MFDVVINPAAASGRVKKVWLRTIETTMFIFLHWNTTFQKL